MQAQMIHNAKKDVLPINVEVGDYVMIRTSAERSHMLQAQWRGPMKIRNAKSHLVFEVENINDGSKFVVHEQRLLLYTATQRGEQASIELKQQSKHYDTKYHLVETLRGLRKTGDKHEVPFSLSARKPSSTKRVTQTKSNSFDKTNSY